MSGTLAMTSTSLVDVATYIATPPKKLQDVLWRSLSRQQHTADSARRTLRGANQLVTGVNLVALPTTIAERLGRASSDEQRLSDLTEVLQRARTIAPVWASDMSIEHRLRLTYYTAHIQLEVLRFALRFIPEESSSDLQETFIDSALALTRGVQEIFGRLRKMLTDIIAQAPVIDGALRAAVDHAAQRLDLSIDAITEYVEAARSAGGWQGFLLRGQQIFTTLGLLALVTTTVPSPPSSTDPTLIVVQQGGAKRVGWSVPVSPPLPPSNPPASSSSIGSLELADRYGSEVFPSREAMPDDLEVFFDATVQEVADYFNVRPGDILGILRAENNDAGYRISQPATSSAGAKGVAQVVVRTWNGWSNPQESVHIRDLRSIEEHGGLGFDWALREEWRAWKNGSSDGSALATANADPNVFENGLSAIARHLVGMGLTRDVAERDPQGFRTQLADGIAIYNSGKPLSESADWTQSAANRKTVAQYVAGAMAVSDNTPLDLTASIEELPVIVDDAPADEITRFIATPLMPMPATFKGFGVKVDYQAGGKHTGIDVANPREGGQEPPLYAVDDATVVHVGPLYCDVANACRGGNSIVLDHGHNVYSIYSHNSSASVSTGQQVSAGEMIGRQGNEGYSFGSHLHFEVHTGAPYSGNWEEPFHGGQFEDPAAWLPG